MKKIIYCLSLLLLALQSYAQNPSIAEGIKKTALPIVYLPADVSIHFISPEPIQYVDISTNHIVGDLPIKNVLRIKAISDSTRQKRFSPGDDAVVTIAGETYMAQYHIIFADDITARDTRTDIDIVPADSRPLDVSGIGFSQPQLKKMAMDVFARSAAKPVTTVKANGIIGSINHIYTAGDYIFLDVSYKNKTRLKYAIDDFTFRIADKKVTKATNVQSVDLKPEYTLLDNPGFDKTYRNIFVFKKLTFPGNKVFQIELDEKQLSGRVITLEMSYKELLSADILSF